MTENWLELRTPEQIARNERARRAAESVFASRELSRMWLTTFDSAFRNGRINRLQAAEASEDELHLVLDQLERLRRKATA